VSTVSAVSAASAVSAVSAVSTVIGDLGVSGSSDETWEDTHILRTEFVLCVCVSEWVARAQWSSASRETLPICAVPGHHILAAVRIRPQSLGRSSHATRQW
jgi:hypothetical protein